MKKTSFIYLAIALIFVAVMIATCNLFDSSPVGVPTPSPAVKAIQTETKEILKNYRKTIKLLQAENDSLQLQIKSGKAELLNAKQKVTVTQIKVKRLSEKTVSEKDTTRKLVYCDSLREQVSVLMDESSVKDSLYEKNISDLTALVQTKDSMFVASEQKCERMQVLLERSLKDQQELTDDVNKLNKQVKKKNRRQKWLGAGLLILSGISSALLISNHR
jgi:hypothetical protein